VLDVCNSQLQPTVASVCAHKTLAKHPIAMFGCEIEWGAGGLQIYAKAKVPSFNCPNTKEDFTNPLSFGIVAGATGEQYAMAKWLCTQPDVRHVVMLGQDIPQQRRDAPAAVTPPLKACGKSVDFVWYPVTAADMTPYINKVIKQDPDFVIPWGGGPVTVQMVKSFAGAGFPVSKILVPDSALEYESSLKPLGATAEGIRATFQFDSWGEKGNPDVSAYMEAMKDSPVDPRTSNAVWGYSQMMLFYNIAKKIGFDRCGTSSRTAPRTGGCSASSEPQTASSRSSGSASTCGASVTSVDTAPIAVRSHARSPSSADRMRCWIQRTSWTREPTASTGPHSA
jgi:ABC-type branched-subunit amino acid transport system substrate-binding protein